MEQRIISGGARIGTKKISRPFARLTVVPGKLELNASIVGKLVFLPEDIVAIHPYAVGAIFGNGLTIVHTVGQYNRGIVFWCTEDTKALVAAISDILGKAPADPIALRRTVRGYQASGSFPLKTGAAVFALALWNVPIIAMLVRGLSTGELHKINDGFVLAGCAIVALCLLLLFSAPAQRLFLKENRGIEDIRTFLYFVLVLVIVITTLFSLTFRFPDVNV